MVSLVVGYSVTSMITDCETLHNYRIISCYQENLNYGLGSGCSSLW